MAMLRSDIEVVEIIGLEALEEIAVGILRGIT